MPSKLCRNALHVAKLQFFEHLFENFDKSKLTQMKVLYRKKNRTKIEESRENPLQQERNRGAKQLKSTSSVPEFSLILPSGSDVETLNATARQSTDPTLLLVGTLTAPIKKTNSAKKSFDICYLQLLDYILSRKFRFSVSFLSPTSH